MIPQFPHCDSRILHAPGECEYCDEHRDWQELREHWAIAFTGHAPAEDQVVCPADRARPPGSGGDHRRWAGNKPTSATGDPSWPRETTASQILYGDHGGRAAWPLAERVRRRVLKPFEDWRMRRRGWRKDENGWWHYP